jgi:hypothetical protein
VKTTTRRRHQHWHIIARTNRRTYLEKHEWNRLALVVTIVALLVLYWVVFAALNPAPLVEDDSARLLPSSYPLPHVPA